MADANALARTHWAYDFSEIINFDPDQAIEKPGLQGYAARTRPLFKRLAGQWSPEKHTEWLLRQYLSLKLIMAASIQIGSADYAYEHNLQMVVPYLSYYAMFNAMRANLLTSPRQAWGNRTLTMGMTWLATTTPKSFVFLCLQPKWKPRLNWR